MDVPTVDFPVVPKADGSGFNILLKSTATKATLTPPPAPNMAAPSALQEDRATREIGGPGANWVDQIGQIGATGDSRAQYEEPPPMTLPESGGPLSRMLPAGWGDTAAAAVGGLNTIERNQSPLAAFGAGMAGAMDVREGRRKDKRAEMLADRELQWRQEDRLYQRGRDVKEDERADKRFDLETKREERAGKAADLNELDTLMGLDDRRIARDKAAAAELADKFGMSVAEQAAADAAVAADLKVVAKDYQLSPDDEPEVQQQKLEAYTTLKQQLTQREYAKYQGANAPGLAPGAPAVAPPPGGGQTAASPVAWAPGQEPKSEGEFMAQAEAAVAANGGNPVYIKNPRTGVVGLYVSKR